MAQATIDFLKVLDRPLLTAHHKRQCEERLLYAVVWGNGVIVQDGEDVTADIIGDLRALTDA